MCPRGWRRRRPLKARSHSIGTSSEAGCARLWLRRIRSNCMMCRSCNAYRFVLRAPLVATVAYMRVRCVDEEACAHNYQMQCRIVIVTFAFACRNRSLNTAGTLTGSECMGALRQRHLRFAPSAAVRICNCSFCGRLPEDLPWYRCSCSCSGSGRDHEFHEFELDCAQKPAAHLRANDRLLNHAREVLSQLI